MRSESFKALQEKTEKIMQNFLSTEPIDRERSARHILKTRLPKLSEVWPEPQFIWCPSPQSAITYAKILSDLHEHTLPRRPASPKMEGGGRNSNKRWRAEVRLEVNLSTRKPKPIMLPDVTNPDMGRLSEGLNEVLAEALGATFLVRMDTWNRTSVTREHRPTLGRIQSIEDIKDAVIRSLTSNPVTELFEEKDVKKGESNLAQIALDFCEPHLSKIKLDPKFFGRRIPLLKSDYATDHSLIRVQDYGAFIFVTDRPKTFKYETFTRPRAWALSVIDAHEGARPALRLHALDGPSIEWRDGIKIYAIHGVLVPEYVVDRPKMITTFRINQERNQEVRRIMMDRYKFGQSVSGSAAYLLDSNSRVLDHDERYGTLHFLSQVKWFMEDIYLLEVVNRTPEPDGSFKHYYLRVPPQISKAKEAVAWTFGFDLDELYLYNPMQES